MVRQLSVGRTSVAELVESFGKSESLDDFRYGVFGLTLDAFSLDNHVRTGRDCP